VYRAASEARGGLSSPCAKETQSLTSTVFSWFCDFGVEVFKWVATIKERSISVDRNLAYLYQNAQHSWSP
jgi:hypothetical protein